MARQPKPPEHRMDKDVRIPLTAMQKQRLMQAASETPEGFAAWARRVLLQASDELLAARSVQKKPKA